MGLEELVDQRPVRQGQQPPQPTTARVIRVDATGCWVAPLEADQRHPVGPCRGAAGVPEGAIVLLVWTAERPWIAAWEEA